MLGFGCRARVDNAKTHDRLAAVGFCRNLYLRSTSTSGIVSYDDYDGYL
jgi:hypothetical protein